MHREVAPPLRHVRAARPPWALRVILMTKEAVRSPGAHTGARRLERLPEFEAAEDTSRHLLIRHRRRCVLGKI